MRRKRDNARGEHGMEPGTQSHIVTSIFMLTGEIIAIINLSLNVSYWAQKHQPPSIENEP